MLSSSSAELAARCAAQQLSGPGARSAGEVVERLLAVQAQDFRAALLAVRARSAGLVASDVHRALEERELVVDWLNRGTLHLVRAEDHALLHALTTPQLRTANATRLRQLGVTPTQAERGVQAVRGELEHGPRTRRELREVLDAARVPTAGQALVHVLFKASLEGHCVRGPVVGKEQAFVLRTDWLPRTRRLDKEQALRELGRRYLAAHAPADERDLAKWAGLGVGEARKALQGVKVDSPATSRLPPPRLLGPFDELLMGWASREPVLGDRQDLITKNGIFKPVVLVKGRAAGTWALARGKVELSLYVELPAAVSAALEKESADVERFLGG